MNMSEVENKVLLEWRIRFSDCRSILRRLLQFWKGVGRAGLFERHSLQNAQASLMESITNLMADIDLFERDLLNTLNLVCALYHDFQDIDICIRHFLRWMQHQRSAPMTGTKLPIYLAWGLPNLRPLCCT